MAKCYQCKYYRASERKCGYKGYSAYPESDCLANEFDSSSRECCGNCKYYNVGAHTCTQRGYSCHPYDTCGCASYKRA